MILASSFKWNKNCLPDPGDLKESEKDEAIAEKWLVKEAGVKPEKLKWITLVDGQRITINGIRPRMTSIVKSKRDPAEILEEMREELCQKQLTRERNTAV
ncbi:hypothetical protein ARMGADRAFT_1169098 [Armillaria gallica]|uniref:Uncharacterized protein n=1 Tax=Armillaria gallica TaxID=47427 RepID=A0A2H3DGS6_ARMGA|nr:hypothetical protein ARMGADRAFT_1169098 [Armillaria gallica]